MNNDIKAIYVSALKREWVISPTDYMTYKTMYDSYGNVESMMYRPELLEIHEKFTGVHSSKMVGTPEANGIVFAKKLLSSLIS